MDRTQLTALPGSVLLDPALDGALPASWQLLDPHVLATHGAIPFSLLGEPVLSTRVQGRLRVLSNVCTHRAAVLLQEPSEWIACPYHGRRFDRAGRCTGAPGFKTPPDEPLPELPVARWQRFHFAALAPTEPLDDLLSAVPWPYGPDADWVVEDPVDHPVDVAWPLVVENYLESLHVPFVHPGLNARIEHWSVQTHVHDRCVIQTADATPTEPAFADGRAAIWAWLWPNTMLNLYPWGVSTNRVLPAGPGRCVVRYQAWVTDPALRRGTVDLGQVELEDQAVVRRVQQGLGSRLYRPGALSPRWEQGVARFHALLRAYLAG